MSTVGFDLDDADLRPLFRDFDLVDLLSFEFKSAVRHLRFCHSCPNPTHPRTILLRPAAGEFEVAACMPDTPLDVRLYSS